MPDERNLGYDQQLQLEDNWCWAAVAASIAAYYEPGTGWLQCSVTDAALQRSDCCEDSGSSLCDRSHSVRAALTITGNLSRTSSPPDFTTVEAELDADRPLAVRVAWKRDGGHVVVIDDCVHPDESPGTLLVRVRDPALADAVWLSLDVLRFSYQNIGRATHVYETRR